MIINLIDRVELSEERKKELDENGKEERERKLYKKLVEDFNKEAVKVNSSYRMTIPIGMKYPKLTSSTKGIVFNKTIDYTEIFFREKKELYGDKDYFYFYKGLKLAVFKAIEPILNKLNFKFHIELKDGDVPTKYKIIEALEK